MLVINIRSLQQILGHESIATTEIHIYMDDNQFHAIVNANPLSYDIQLSIWLINIMRRYINIDRESIINKKQAFLLNSYQVTKWNVCIAKKRFNFMLCSICIIRFRVHNNQF